MKSLRCLLFLCYFSAPALDAAETAQPFTLADGDRVVFIGNTLIEREQRYGYWETMLTRHFPGKSIVFRNLGWSGDTVFGEARASFGSIADGFRHLKDHVLALKPTVLIIGYGANESFAGPKELPKFVKGLQTLLDTLAPTKARIVLLSPLKQENLGRPLPDPKEQNKNLRLYADAIRDVAKKRGHLFVDLYDLLGKEKQPLTDNGIHLTAYGYWRSAVVLERALNLPSTNWQIEMNAKGKMDKANGAHTDKFVAKPLRFQMTAEMLPAPPPPQEAPPLTKADQSRLSVKGLPAGKYTLRVDGKFMANTVAQSWAQGLSLFCEADLRQAEKLRQAIVAKNRLYFYRWRPENETYLFGFRKHEQGKNAREIPQFDPLIAAKEKEIVKLCLPVPHSYELKAEK